MFHLRHATVEDAEALRLVIEASLGDVVDVARLTDLLAQGRQTLVVYEALSGQIVGFCDGFRTQDAEGKGRWEVDLIGVHPSWQGRGLARRLLAEQLKIALASNVQQARALIAEQNSASQKAFRAQGFIPDAERVVLCLLSGYALEWQALARVVPVTTLTYTGNWLETISMDRLAQALMDAPKTQDNMLVGAVIPESALVTHVHLQDLLQVLGQYQWWRYAWSVEAKD